MGWPNIWIYEDLNIYEYMNNIKHCLIYKIRGYFRPKDSFVSYTFVDIPTFL